MNTKIAEKEHLEAGTCPYCAQSFTNAAKIAAVAGEIDSFGEQIQTLELSIVAHTNDIVGVDSKIEEQKHVVAKLYEDIDKAEKTIQPFINKHDEIKKSLTAMRVAHPDLMSISDIQKVMGDITKLEAKIEDASKEVANPYLDQIEVMRGDIQEVDTSSLDAMVQLDSHYKVLVKLLTDSKSFIRRNIIDQYIPFINKRVNEYIEQLASPHKVMINSDLTVDIYMNQATTMSYGNLSAGERLRVNFAISLAFRDFISTTGHKCNLLMIDELFDSGADNSFMNNSLKLLKRGGETVMLISHREEMKDSVDKVITIVKEGGFSEVRG
jgi:DNA repair exonuclease SbcCD ATPase subunit